MRVVFVGRDRIVWRRLVLYVVTLGISRRIWLHRVNKEIDGHEALGLRHGWNAFLLCLPVIGPAIVTVQTARRTAPMVATADIRYGPGVVVGLLGAIPILGALPFIAWQQSRLNKFWAHERAHPEHGVDLDVGLESDPGFLVEMGAALRESYFAGSRFDRKRKAKRARWEARRESWSSIRAERAAVRAAGGSTPLLPFLRPKRPEPRLLKITCGRCQTAFSVRRDPAAETPLVCPNCALTEVLPALHQEPLVRPEPAAVPALKVKCPQCATKFHAVRNLHGPTELTCPSCGRTDSFDDGVRVPVAAS